MVVSLGLRERVLDNSSIGRFCAAASLQARHSGVKASQERCAHRGGGGLDELAIEIEICGVGDCVVSSR